jgi:hypothetical protein
MKLSQLAAKPQLIKIVLDDEAIITAHGEPVEFYTWDRQPLETFMKLAAAQNADMAGIIDIVRTLILDEAGKEIITKDSMLPTDVLIAAIARITNTLGK